ncbi:hypothetical protein BGZ95_011620 [Linnemannia exigua]|uniref:C2H2-type domain-containing protein n=1 Tax=Linnemannia exigua TaxID=604196 RepID=A0AAD4H547_9FUNG|nr:hypothetical protein BGZ95_011620 [Linnemannia exigua]
MSSPFPFTFEMAIPPRPQQLQLQPQPSQFQFRPLQLAAPERQDDPMMDYIDYNQAAAIASIEQLLSAPTDFPCPEEDSDNFLLLNNIAATHTIPTTTHNVFLSNPHVYRRSQRQYLFSTIDITDNNRTPNKVLDTRQESYYPGLEQPSHYEDNFESLFLNQDGLEQLDFSENTDPFDLQEYLKNYVYPKVDYTIPSSDESLLPVSVQAYEEPALSTANPEESAAVVNMTVDGCCSEDEDDSGSECESDEDDDEIAVAAPMIIHVPPTPSPSPPPSIQQSQPHVVPSQVPEKPKIPRSRAKKGEKRIHACPDCRREFTRACNLQSHILTHSNLKPYGCSECDKTFARVYDMQRHKRIHSNKLEDKPYSCPDCPTRFKRTEPRNRHRQSVHGWIPV